jgi:hypothetical protein
MPTALVFTRATTGIATLIFTSRLRTMHLMGSLTRSRHTCERLTRGALLQSHKTSTQNQQIDCFMSKWMRRCMTQRTWLQTITQCTLCLFWCLFAYWCILCFWHSCREKNEIKKTKEVCLSYLPDCYIRFKSTFANQPKQST